MKIKVLKKKINRRDSYWEAKDRFYKNFVDTNVPFGGDGDAWPGEEGTEYEDRFKEEVTPHDVWVFISDLIKKELSPIRT